jgi:hypothetical protein
MKRLLSAGRDNQVSGSLSLCGSLRLCGLGLRLDRWKGAGSREGAKTQSIARRNWGTGLHKYCAPNGAFKKEKEWGEARNRLLSPLPSNGFLQKAEVVVRS